ncbi:MAG: tetratricopeptide repeat protein [Acidobacteriota bacterium]
MAAHRLTEAMRLYGLAVRRQPTWAEGWWHLGTLSFETGRFTEASDAFLHFVKANRKEPGPGFGMLGLSDFHLKHYHRALAALERGRELGLGTDPDFVHSVLYYDGILFNFFGQPEIALKRLALVAVQMAAENPKEPEQAVLGNGDLLDAFGLAALRIPKLPSGLDAMKEPVVREAGHAQALIALQDFVKAGAELKELVALYPTEPGVHYMYGVYLLKEDPPLAIGQFRRELQVSPSNVVARIQLALEFLRLGEYNHGLKYAQEAVAQAPDNFIGHVACGRLWLGLGKTDLAVKQLRIAVKLAPGSPDAHFALSEALSQAGLNAEAARERAAFKRLKALGNGAHQQH